MHFWINGAVCKSLRNAFAHETMSWVWPQRVEWDLKGSIKPQDIALPDIRTFGQEIKFLCVLAIFRWKILRVFVVQAPACKN